MTIKFFKDKLPMLPVLFLAAITLWPRLVNLGYADYEEDEIKALFLPAPGQGLWDFLVQQRKGPVQFIVTYLEKLATPDYHNQWITRLPFTLAGILAVFVFYHLVKLHYGKKVALYASLLMALNGIYIGLTRVVQYQPFVMLFSVLALYAFSKIPAGGKWKNRGLYGGMLFWTAALLTHYDAIFFAPLAFYLIYRGYFQNAEQPVSTLVKPLALMVAACALLLGSFYIPLFASATEGTLNYWRFRFTETAGVIRPSSSLFTFNLYNPILALYLYLAAGILSIPKIKHTWPVLVWFLFPWVVLEVVMREPGTHIYTYLMPAFILVAFGLTTLEEGLVRIFGPGPGRWANAAILVVVFGFSSALAHLIFVDHTPEYPWEARRILFWKIGGLTDPAYNVWPYGFAYNRHWEEIGQYIMTNNPNGYYSTNEVKIITEFYVPQRPDVDQSGYYIHIYNAQSLKDALVAKEKVRYWTKHYPPVATFLNDGRVVAEIYRMPEGTLEGIRSKGY